MNTQEKELKHCTACNQMTNHSGETCLKHIPDTEKNAYSRGYKQGRFDADMDRLNKTPTPDTEWEKEFDVIFPQFLEYPDSFTTQFETDPANRRKIKDFITKTISSRDTYWKERVGKDYQAIKETPAYINLMTQWGQLDEDGVCIAVSRQALEETIQALDTLLDNLK